jgi:hypothetical protein
MTRRSGDASPTLVLAIRTLDPRSKRRSPIDDDATGIFPQGVIELKVVKKQPCHIMPAARVNRVRRNGAHAQYPIDPHKQRLIKRGGHEGNDPVSAPEAFLPLYPLIHFEASVSSHPQIVRRPASRCPSLMSNEPCSSEVNVNPSFLEKIVEADHCEVSNRRVVWQVLGAS